jgi:ligand-binding sensor domain-containing protein
VIKISFLSMGIQGFEKKIYRNIAATVAIFLFLGGLSLHAQSGVTVYNTSNSGLPYDAVWAVATAPDGKVWFGTDWGLGSYDGSTWQVYRTTNSGLPNDAVRSVMVDDSNVVWVGTVIGGLARFDGSNWTVYNTGNSGLPADHVRCLAGDDAGGVYMGTDAGVAKLQDTVWTVWDLPSLGVGSNNAPSICVTGIDSFWVGTVNGGLVHIADTVVTVFTHANSGLVDNTVVGIAVDAGDDLWLATPAGGMVYYQNQVFLTYNAFNSGNPTMSHSSMVLDGNSGKWAGSLDQGVVYYAAPTWLHFDTSNSGVPQQYVRCLAHDPLTGRIWGGTSTQGAFVLDPVIALAAGDAGMTDGFRIYPNPAQDYLRWTGQVDGLVVYDMRGRRVLTDAGIGNALDLTGLPIGVYAVHASLGNATRFARLVIAR